MKAKARKPGRHWPDSPIALRRGRGYRATMGKIAVVILIVANTFVCPIRCAGPLACSVDHIGNQSELAPASSCCCSGPTRCTSDVPSESNAPLEDCDCSACYCDGAILGGAVVLDEFRPRESLHSNILFVTLDAVALRSRRVFDACRTSLIPCAPDARVSFQVWLI